MFKKFQTVTIVAGLVLAIALAGGCSKEEKKEETSKKAASAPAEASVPAIAKPAASIFFSNFESNTDGWTGMDKEITLGTAKHRKHSGDSSLKVAGPSGGERWNFAVSPNFPLKAGTKYKLTGWMMVESLDNPKQPPQLKCGVMQGKKYLNNFFTKKYETANMNKWQELSVTFEAPQGATDGFVGLEKGTKDPVSAVIYLDDVNVEPAQ